MGVRFTREMSGTGAIPTFARIIEDQAVLASPLVGVEYLRPSLAQGFLQSRYTEVGVQSVGKLPGQHVPAVQSMMATRYRKP